MARWRIAGTKKHGGAEKRAGKNFPSPDPFPFLPALFFGGAGALPPIVAFKFFVLNSFSLTPCLWQASPCFVD
ncbi:hypothetical protein CO115_04620 [Candidatus Falkowbacteria bacterium CG_4_9_14_3_um_filter_36_9]|uniref:Uncharacterized protein n=2 Tax=Candidatus Falkowiibacteriota TaxID=1752728 RepID=A0A1J4TA26_9BACT|nr:MAG: hypothetical protein AUJ27_02040 [Candidatus Falkowbacteria bacterium CG1_02_37_44]PIV51431.1 MAG: hypothetical protein COS18_02755 [Candidatus Falkowbacteria bacterium CG02_land_8_20_14_3_00_36_14]PIX11042.1 MAG: hypothetical protein COZ73_03755 [Candidatus Falkowbacteria bacterium CG_4_8_14_3_um_filter_36_11]PJB18412.1 MAG: hypothetical protein CO115_04620 [Candidatus Falkowbacteria bacterium CG_4_9_14_3_um_filter_36_9]